LVFVSPRYLKFKTSFKKATL